MRLFDSLLKLSSQYFYQYGQSWRCCCPGCRNSRLCAACLRNAV